MPPSDGSVWLASAQCLWDQGHRQAAVQQVLDVINAAGSQRPRSACIQLAFYMFLNGDYEAAIAVLSQLEALYPNDAEIVEQLAVNYSRAGRHLDALHWLRKAQALAPKSWNILDGIASNAASLELWDEARDAGEASLRFKDASVSPPPGWISPTSSAQEWLNQRPSCPDVIAFSLWGANPRYLRGALRNLLLIPELMPGWTPRFYVDSSVPRLFLEQAQELGAQLFVQPSTPSLLQRLGWRFLVASDPSVSRFLVRDSDSVVSLREAKAVREWVESDCCFHVMRDWWSHTDLILAGLWGGVSQWLPNMQAMMDSYQGGLLITPNIDQWFLRDCIWPLIRTSVLVHDRCFRGLHSRPWPDPDTPMSLHVGANESVARRDHQRAWLKPWLAALPCLRDPNWSAQVDQGLVPDPSLLRARMPQQLAVPSSPAQPLEHVYGFYINLDTQVERDHTMRAQFERLGLSGVYQRFNAIGASLAEAHSVGLKSAGELGLWRSTLALLQSLELQDLQPNGLIHILEDDAIVCDQWPFHLASTLPSLLNQHSVSFDLLFTDSFLTPSLARKLSALDQLRSVDELFFLDGGLYLACTSSYILPVSSLRSLVLLLLESFERRPLSPLDMVLRDLMLTRKLRVLISSPFLTTIDSTASSGIQSNRRSSVLLKMQIDILLRRQFFVESLPLLSDLQSWFGDLLSSGSGDDQALLLANLIDHWELSGLLSSY